MFRSSLEKQYLRWRKINGALNDLLVESLQFDDLMNGARNLGLKAGRGTFGGTAEELDLLMDHCLYDLRHRDGRNAVERFAASSARLSEDERRVLDQMCQFQFRLLMFYEDPVGVVFDVTDVFRLEHIRLIDIGLSRSAKEGSMILGHTVPTSIDGVWATSGAMLPIGSQDIEGILSKLERVLPKDLPNLAKLTAAQWSEVARVCFRTALKNGCAEFVAFQKPSESGRTRALETRSPSLMMGQ